MIPRLPAEQIRAAIQSGEWPQAAALLADHDDAVAVVLADVDLSATERAPWLALLHDQQALMVELRSARDAAGTALTNLDQTQRGARAWMRELA